MFGVRKQAVYILLNALMVIVSLVIVTTSFGTQDWVRATAKPNKSGPLQSDVNYGLFKGKLFRRPVNSPYEYEIQLTCAWSSNKCAWSCAKTAEEREREVETLVDGRKSNFTCVPTKFSVDPSLFRSEVTEEVIKDAVFINAGLWLSTVIFLAVLMLALLVSLVLSILNSAKSPAETFFNIQGIYISNSVALVSNFLALLLYGICFGKYIDEDISILDTIVGDFESDASLGYSYWILIVPCVFHPIGIFLLAMRERIVNSNRGEMKIEMSAEVPGQGVLF